MIFESTRYHHVGHFIAIGEQQFLAFNRWLRFFIFALMMLALAAAVIPAKNYRSTESPFKVKEFKAKQESRVIEVGKPIHEKLAGGQSHIYKLMLNSNQYLNLTVNQQGIDVVVTLIDPDGKKLLEVDSPNGGIGPEHLLTVTKISGDFHLEIRPLEKDAAAGEYEVRLEELRPANADDYTRVSAYSVFSEAYRLATQGALSGPAELLRTALKKYQEALSLYRLADDASNEALTLFEIGEVYNYLDQSQTALEYYVQALTRVQTSKNHVLEANILRKLGFTYFVLGENQKALDFCLKALRLIQEMGDRITEGYASYELGVIYNSLGEQQRSLEYFNNALLISHQIPNLYLEAAVLQRLGVVYGSLGDSERALSFLNKALDLNKRTEDHRAEAFGLSELGKLYASLGQHEKAIDFFSRALALSRSADMRRIEAETLNSMGMTLWSLGRNQEALVTLRSSLDLSKKIADQQIEANALYGIAKIERGEGRLENSRATIEAAIAIVDSLRSKIGSQNIRLSYFASVQGFYGFYIDLLMELNSVEPSKRFSALAFEVNERVRARSLLEMLTEASISIDKGVDPSLLERQRALQRALNATAERQMRILGQSHTTEEAASLAKELQTLTSEYEMVEAEIRLKTPRYAALTHPQFLTVTEIQNRVLDDDTLLLEYALGDNRSFMWAVTRQSIKSYELPKRADIEAQALVLFRLWSSPGNDPHNRRVSNSEAEYLRVASRLSSILLGPVAQDLRKQRLLIVTQGALQFLSFGALPDPSGREIQANAPLLLNHEIVYAPSASIIELLRRETSNHEPPPKTVAVFADPVFQASDSRVLSNHANRGTNKAAISTNNLPASLPMRLSDESADVSNSLPRLFGTRWEAQQITTLAPKSQTMMALDFQANRQTALSSELSQYRIIHFATHAFINDSHPELSGVVLSLVDKHGNPQDGFLRVNEIFNLRLSADLVVLSGCGTGLGKEVKGEGIVGLSRGFMYAGTPRVIVSLWNTDDRSTAGLMTLLYNKMLKGGLRPAAALRAAQIEVWRHTGWQQPYYWAGFILQGDW